MSKADIPTNGTPKIGVYVCHCGINISSKVDILQTVEFSKNLPYVTVAKEYKFMCSDPGQELIQQDISEGKVDRVVVASCSPLMHELTFRRAIAKGGGNPFLFQMANIREHVSWVTFDKRFATEKAKALIAAAVERIALHQPLQRNQVSVHPDVMVVGGGIAGIHAALTMADSGRKVYLVEREPTIGGHMAKFDKTFPTLDCAACILTPKMSAVRAHPNITLWTYSEVIQVDGFVGNFKVKVKRKPRYVSEELCVGCSECIEACIYKKGRVKDEFDMGLRMRKPVYIPFPQATPLVAVIDPDTCVQLRTGKCKKPCEEACEPKAIDFNQTEEIKEIEVGAIILATGFKVFDAKRISRYGYGKYPNIYTSLEVERMVNAAGPTGGEVLLEDGKPPKVVGIVHCVGSRDNNTNPYCSRVFTSTCEHPAKATRNSMKNCFRKVCILFVDAWLKSQIGL
jgi:heterodisulfide reductase subunit A